MTSVELGQRLVSDVSSKDLSLVGADVRMVILDAINQGLQKINKSGPAHWKQVLSSLYIKAPEQISLTVTKGSSTFGAWSATDDTMYCSIRIDGDGILHQIVDTNELLDVYTGESGTVNATLYYDAILIHQPVEHFVTDPYLVECYRRLTRISQDTESQRRLNINRSVGEPTAYTLEPNSLNSGTPGVFVMRLNTLPGKDYRLRVMAQMSSMGLKFEDMVIPVDLPIRDNLVESYLMPIARAALSATNFWKNNESIGDVKARGIDAEHNIDQMLPSLTMGAQTNKVRTGRGY